MRDVHLRIPEGTITGLIGPNGAGKSTLLNVIAGLAVVESGAIRLDEDSLVGVRPDRLNRYGLCCVPRTADIFTMLSVIQNPTLAVRRCRDPQQERISATLDMFPAFAEIRQVWGGGLSGGQRHVQGLPSLALNFGLGGFAVSPLRFGATATLLGNGSPPNIVEIIETCKATVCFTAPTAFRAMLRAMNEGADISSLRAAVSVGETLPGPVYGEWQARTGKPATGYEAKVIGPNGAELHCGEVGRLAVRGPTGCRHLRGERRGENMPDGWNTSGDAHSRDANGYFHLAARNDDMIVSAGYSIAGLEVEAALMSHSAVAECAVIGLPDEKHGAIMQAHVVLDSGKAPSKTMVKLSQDHVKATIAPHKYPRSVIFVDALAMTESGKIQWFKLRVTS